MRFLLYSHDSFGLGHIRRTLSITGRLLADFPESSALIVTGAPRAHILDFPERCDYVKLPSVSKGPGGGYVSRELGMTLEQTVNLRTRLIAQSAESFQPDLIVVDHAPLGLCGEFAPVLRWRLPGARSPQRLYGMRGIIDEPEAVLPAWQRDDVFGCFRHCYDSVLIYSDRSVFDPIKEYRIPADIAERMVFTGYIPRDGSPSSDEEVRQRFAPRTGKLVVVTAGGGGDGDGAIGAYLEAVEKLGPSCGFESVVVTGPLMKREDRRRLQGKASAVAVTFLEYHDNLPGLYRAADFVVAMAGYNTICELACAGANCLLLARTFPRREQLIHARRLAARGVARYLRLETATAAGIASEVVRGLERSRPPRYWGLNFSGLKSISATIAVTLGGDSRAVGEGTYP